MGRSDRGQSDVVDSFLAGLAVLAVFVVIVIAFPIEAVSLDHLIGMGALLLFAFGIVGLFARRTADITVGFTILTIALIAWIAQFLPDFFTRPFAGLDSFLFSLTGVRVGAIDPNTLLVLSVVFVTAMIALKIRLTGERRFARETFDLTLSRLQRFVSIYARWIGLIALFVVGSLSILLAESAQVIGEAGNLAAEAPFVVASLLTTLAGYLSLGGELPVIVTVPLLGDLGPIDFLAFAFLVIAAAAATEYEGTGPLSQFLRR